MSPRADLGSSKKVFIPNDGRKSPFLVAAPSKAWVCGHLLAGIVDSNPVGGTDVCFECCVLSGRGLCVGRINRPEESCRVCCVCVCVIRCNNNHLHLQE